MKIFEFAPAYPLFGLGIFVNPLQKKVIIVDFLYSMGEVHLCKFD